MKIKQQQCDRCEGSGTVAVQDGLGEQMRKYRMSQGLSLREVARRIEKSAVFVSQLETGQAVWSNKNIELYFSAFKEPKAVA